MNRQGKYKAVVRIYKDNKFWSQIVIDSRYDNIFNREQAEEYIKRYLIPKEDKELYSWSCYKK